MNVVSFNQDYFFVDRQKLQVVGEATAKWLGDFDPNGKPLLEYQYRRRGRYAARDIPPIVRAAVKLFVRSLRR